MKGAQALEARSADFAAAMAAETGASAIWAGFNVHLAVDMLLEAASLTTRSTVSLSLRICPVPFPLACKRRHSRDQN